MAKGQVNLSVVRTNDDKLLLQVQQPDPVNKVIENNMTVHNDMDQLCEAFRRKVSQQLA